MFTVYILYSFGHDKTYVGYTSNLLFRFHSHNSIATKGWTVRFRPWVVVHAEYLTNKKEAINREKELKSGKGREWIKQSLCSWKKLFS